MVIQQRHFDVVEGEWDEDVEKEILGDGLIKFALNYVAKWEERVILSVIRPTLSISVYLLLPLLTPCNCAYLTTISL